MLLGSRALWPGTAKGVWLMRIAFFLAVAWVAVLTFLPSGLEACQERFSASTCQHTLR